MIDFLIWSLACLGGGFALSVFVGAFIAAGMED